MDSLIDFFKKDRDGWRVRNIEKLGIENKQFNVFTIVCPLFKPGLLSESELIENAKSLEESRIFSKFKELKKTLKILQNECKKRDIELILNIVFADKAVPLEKDSDIRNSLNRNLEIWSFEAQNLSEEIGCKCNTIISASDIISCVPDIINIKSFSGIDNDKDIVIKIEKILEEWFTLKVIDSSETFLNREKMKVIKRMRLFFGLELTTVLLLNYISLDWKIPKLFNIDMIISIERFGLLHTISKLTDAMRDIPKLEITV